MARASDGNEQLLLLLRQEPEAGQEADRRSRRLHLGECIDLCNEIIDEELTATTSTSTRCRAEGHLRRPQRLRHALPGGGEAHAVGGGLQPLQARADGAGRRGQNQSNILLLGPTGCGKACSRRHAGADPQRPVRDRRRLR